MRWAALLVFVSGCIPNIEVAAQQCEIFQINRRTFRVTSTEHRDSINREAAMLRAAQIALSEGYMGFIVFDDETGSQDTEATAKVRFNRVRVRSHSVDTTTLTVGMLTREEMTQPQPGGAIVYDAEVIVGQYGQ